MAEREDIIKHSKDLPYYSFEPWLKERLEWFKDQKFGLIMHWGIYSISGICESWPLSPFDTWARQENTPGWMESGRDLKKFSQWYREQNKFFNPSFFEPEVWARIAKQAHFKYLCLTSKHHDGYCLWDTKTTDYKVTGKDTPFHTNPRANILRESFDAFRKEGLAIWCYFSKADWHNPNYWSPDFSMLDCTRNPNYDTAAHPEIWERFVQFTHEQIRELLTDYGKIDCLWLDGGQVCPQNKQDIRMDEIAAFGRKLQPGLLIADRTVGGPHENFITPEQTIPAEALDVPWESCITLGQDWGHSLHQKYKSATDVIRMLMEIVAKGGNLLLGFGPSREGRLDTAVIRVLEEIGAWMDINQEAVFGTRPIAPFADRSVRFTQKNNKVYAVALYDPGLDASDMRIPLCKLQPKKGTHVTMLGYDKEIHWEQKGDQAICYLPPVAERPCKHAWTLVFDKP